MRRLRQWGSSILVKSRCKVRKYINKCLLVFYPESHVGSYPHMLQRLGSKLRSSITYQLPIVDMLFCEFVCGSKVLRYISCGTLH